MNSEEEAMTIKDIKETVLLLKKTADEKSDENNSKVSELKKLTDQRMEIEVELNSLHKRSIELEEDTNTSNESVEVIQMQTENFIKIVDENERWRKEYEKKQMDTDERMEDMTTIIKTAYASTEAASAKYDEAFERLHNTTDNIGKLEKKIDAARKRIDQREKEIKEKVAVYKQLQCKSEQRIENEQKKEQYINYLKKQVEEAELRADKAEAEVVLKQADLERLKNKLKHENASVGCLKKDMDSMYSEFKKL